MPALRRSNAAVAPEVPPDDGPPAVFDAAHLDRQTAGDKTLQADLLALFLDQAETIVPKVIANEAGRPAFCHRLTGAARAIGAWRFAQAAEQVEAGGPPVLLTRALADLTPMIRARSTAASEQAGSPVPPLL